jgi:hypothetical protein
MGYTAAPLAFQERISLFYPKNRKEEDGDVVIYPFKVGLVKSTGRAPPGMAVKIYGFRLNSPYEKKHGLKREMIMYGKLRSKHIEAPCAFSIGRSIFVM